MKPFKIIDRKKNPLETSSNNSTLTKTHKNSQMNMIESWQYDLSDQLHVWGDQYIERIGFYHEIHE